MGGLIGWEDQLGAVNFMKTSGGRKANVKSILV